MFKRIMRREEGFTLIELLVVIAVLGVLATVVIVAINPLQQLARSRDTGRISTVTQMGQALVSNATATNNTYVTANNTWITSLVTAGEVATIPSAVNYAVTGTAACVGTGGGVQNGFCYKVTAVNGGPAIAYARLEAASNTSRCAVGQLAYFVYSSADGRGGIVCGAAEPNAGAQTFLP